MKHHTEKIRQEIDDLNCIIKFLAKRDLEDLTSEALFRHRGIRQADRLILLGGITTPDFADIAAHSFKQGVVTGLMVVGGTGHSTQNLRNNITAHPLYGTVKTTGQPEADMLYDILVNFHGIRRDAIVVENKSTNCGNNASYALESVRSISSVPKFAIILQDPIMERRTYEAFLHEWRTEQTIFDCFAPVIPLLEFQAQKIVFQDATYGQYYNMNGFLDLVMGEIPRLRDDENGYGPKGHGFFGHVDIPEPVLIAFERLIRKYPHHVRPKITECRNIENVNTKGLKNKSAP